MAEGLTSGAPALTQGVVLVMLAKHRWHHVPWAWLQLVRGPRALARAPGLRFAKVMGSGAGGGFGLRPSATHQGLIALFDTVDHAECFVGGDRVQAHRRRSQDWWCGLMVINSARGQWDGHLWADTSHPNAGHPGPRTADSSVGPVAALTRASIRPSRAWRFWRHAPAAQAALADVDGCDLAVGLGEAPLLRQCTFSLWRDEASLVAYARGGAHGQAAQAAWRHDFFSESLFVRMKLLDSHGHWPRRSAHG